MSGCSFSQKIFATQIFFGNPVLSYSVFHLFHKCTPVRKTRRKYEEKNKEKRKQASGNFGTMIPRALYDEINAFLEENGITKVRLIKEGYEALKNMKKDGKL